MSEKIILAPCSDERDYKCVIMDVTLHAFKNLGRIRLFDWDGKKMENSPLDNLMKYLHDTWVGPEESREKDTRMGTMYLMREKDGSLHIDIALRWNATDDEIEGIMTGDIKPSHT